MNYDGVEGLFRVHKLNEAGLEKCRESADMFEGLGKFLCDNIDDSRHLSIAFTKLEEASFFAKKAIAIDPENQL